MKQEAAVVLGRGKADEYVPASAVAATVVTFVAVGAVIISMAEEEEAGTYLANNSSSSSTTSSTSEQALVTAAIWDLRLLAAVVAVYLPPAVARAAVTAAMTAMAVAAAIRKKACLPPTLPGLSMVSGWAAVALVVMVAVVTVPVMAAMLKEVPAANFPAAIAAALRSEGNRRFVPTLPERLGGERVDQPPFPRRKTLPVTHPDVLDGTKPRLMPTPTQELPLLLLPLRGVDLQRRFRRKSWYGGRQRHRRQQQERPVAGVRV